MGKYLIQHDRPNCIGCGACVAVCSEHWEMNQDGKSDIIDGKLLENGWQEKETDDLSCNKEAADSCPVNVIHIVERATGKTLV